MNPRTIEVYGSTKIDSLHPTVHNGPELQKPQHHARHQGLRSVHSEGREEKVVVIIPYCDAPLHSAKTF
jgi:hypothetical protein